MLVVTRSVGDEIVIGDPKNPIAIVRLCAILGNTKARIGIDAPANIPVHRYEVACEAGQVVSIDVPASRSSA